MPITDLLDDLLAALLPACCPGCGCRGPEPVCCSCASRLDPAPRAPPPPGVSWWTAAYAYRGVARELVARAKYRDERVALKWLATRLVERCSAAPRQIDVVTWAPASATRRVAHGIDHGTVLARAVATGLDRPIRPLLARVSGPAQTGRDASTRRRGPDLRPVAAITGIVLVVDDVATTGGTLAAAARALRVAGAREVFAATAARTPAAPTVRADAYTSRHPLNDGEAHG